MNDVAQLTIRPAAEDDAERLAALLTDEGYPAGPTDLERRIRGFAGPATRVLVAEQAGEVLGFIAFVLVPRFETEDRFIRIVTVIRVMIFAIIWLVLIVLLVLIFLRLQSLDLIAQFLERGDKPQMRNRFAFESQSDRLHIDLRGAGVNFHFAEVL